MARTYYVYILASESRELYVGVTNDVYKRYRSIEVVEIRGATLPSTRFSAWSIMSRQLMRYRLFVERSRSKGGLAGERLS
jgi:hypothetical protein